MIILGISILAAIFITGYFVGRNNPNLEVVNKLVNAGKVVVDKTGKIVKAIKE